MAVKPRISKHLDQIGTPGGGGGGDVVGPASAVDERIATFDGVTGKLIKDGGVLISELMRALDTTPVKTANYSANDNEYIPCNVGSGEFTVTLPDTPADGTRMIVENVTVATTTNVLTISTSGSDVFAVAGGPSSVHIGLPLEALVLQYDASIAVWLVIHNAPPSNFAVNFPGVDAQTPLTSADISINTTSMILTITPPLGYFNITVDGGGKSTRFRKDGNVDFDAFTNTSGEWFFYFDSTGTPVTTQTPWTIADFPFTAPIYRIYWNATLSGAARLVDEYVEYHQNTIAAQVHGWMHLQGAIHGDGFTMVNNAVTSGAPNADGSETVIGLTTGTNIDDNLAYTVTNDSTPTADWEQDLGDTNAGTLDSTNSALFETFVQDAGGLVSYLPATRFPFPWDSGTDEPEYITSSGVRTKLTTTYYNVIFVYANQNPRVGEALRIVTAPAEYSDIDDARAIGWTDIQNTYSILANDGEIRPLYRLIFQIRSSASPYPQAAKYSALRETQDIRKAAVTSTAAATGSLPATSVVVTPAGDISSTNAQSALEELDTEKQSLVGDYDATKVFALSGDISPAQITGDQNNYNPTDLDVSSTLRLSTDASRNITGLAGGADGRVIIIHNIGSNDLVLNSENASSTAANRFLFDADVTLTADQSVILRYDATSSRWRLISKIAAAGGSSALPYIKIEDQKAQNTDGGTATAGSWRTRDLNTKIADTGDNASITKITFNSGSDEPSAGDEIEGVTSGATGDVFDIVIDSGTWGGGDADGEIWLNNVSGTFQSEVLKNNTTVDADIADCDDAQTQNQIRLVSGEWKVFATTPSYRTNGNQSRLQDVTNTATLILGTVDMAVAVSAGEMTTNFLSGVFTLGVNSTLELQHYPQSTLANKGWGRAVNITTEVYSMVELWKRA